MAGGDEEAEAAAPVKVEVPVIGGELDTFFTTKTIDQITDRVEMGVDDMNDIFCEAGEM